MRAKGFEGMTCSVADVMGALGDRWGVLIMRDLMLGLARYDDLKQSTDVTNATLSDRLKSLETAGLIERRQYQSKPDRYEYVLTERGQDIGLVMQAFVQVGDHWNTSNLAGPPLQFVDKRTGHPVRLAAIDSQSGQPVGARDIAVIAGPGADERVKWRLGRKAGPSA